MATKFVSNTFKIPVAKIWILFKVAPEITPVFLLRDKLATPKLTKSLLKLCFTTVSAQM